MPLDLLTPLGAEAQLRANYLHQLEQTIQAYLPSYIFIGEALQNALDAVRTAQGGSHEINVTIDLDDRSVTVVDDGVGFPNKPNLLFLGGGEKYGKGLAGQVGVGLKVVLFSSDHFSLRATNDGGSLAVEVMDAYRFKEDPPPVLQLPESDTLPVDTTPLFPAGTGTSISYSFPPGQDGVPEQFFRDVREEALSGGATGFAASLGHGVNNGAYPNRLAVLLASYFRRFSYLGSTAQPDELKDVAVRFKVIANNTAALGDLSELLDGVPEFEFEAQPDYFTVDESLTWTPPPKPVIRDDALGVGGSNITKRASAFNVTRYDDEAGFEELLTGAAGRGSDDLELFKRLLFPKLRSLTVTIGRIPQFKRLLPGSARRVISARGTVTGHDIPISSGQNQQYVRCLDLVFDVDGDLNYGKTALTDMHLVANVRRFANEAYRLTLQNAARNLVGKVGTTTTTSEKFWEREYLGADDLTQVKVPRDENDVIALTFELAGRGRLPEFRWFGLSSYDTYDARALIERQTDSEEILTDHKQENLRIVEFKLRGGSVARDFDREEKEFSAVDLVVCYEVGESPVDTYQIVPINDSTVYTSLEGPYPHVTHVLFDTNTGEEVQILPIRDLLAEQPPPSDPPHVPDDAMEE